MEIVSNYFSGDSIAADTWRGKYQMKDENGTPLENTPREMHIRLAKEFARIEYGYIKTERLNIDKGSKLEPIDISSLSPFGQQLFLKRQKQNEQDIVDEIFSFFDQFQRIVPQGSIMSNLGNKYVFGSLSNCFVISSPEDSYGGILRADEELVQLMKRRGGVGTTLDNLRPVGAYVSNAAQSSTGVPSFAERFSNSTREVAQDGRRGALMLLLSVKHPDIFKFVTVKDNLTKVTGANISVMFTDEFMKLVEDGATSYICRFPVDVEITKGIELVVENILYNTLVPTDTKAKYIMRINPLELFEVFTGMAHNNAEPGAAYIDRIQNYSPDGVYERFRPTKCNPCGEIWMGDYDACRLIAQNFLSVVRGAYSPYAYIDFDELYETSYMQQRYSDALIDLEVEYIQRIIDKLDRDTELNKVKPEEVKREKELWLKIQSNTRDGRRTGNGFTALGDMLAALGTVYGSDSSLQIIEKVMKTKMEAELDSTIDMAILRGPFVGWDAKKEFRMENSGGILRQMKWRGCNSFFDMLMEDFPIQANRMAQFGRRNVSWSTVAPTGTVSMMTQSTSGLEPLFKAFYIRRKKINPNDIGVRVDFTDQNGDNWQEYPILHPQFKNWITSLVNGGTLEKEIEDMTKEDIQGLFEQSPWYGSEADNIDWEKRIEIQSIIQKYTSNSISSTINLPEDVSKDIVKGIYFQAWKKGLKGVTIYREGSRTGVLISDNSSNKLTKPDEFGYNDAVKRPKDLGADYYFIKHRGRKYAVLIGLLNNNPYELFAFENPLFEEDLHGKITKVEKGVYSFVSEHYQIDNLQLSSSHTDEKLLTRWVSLLLRHGVNPKFIAEQVEKSEVHIINFAKVVSRILKRYIPDEVLSGEVCDECGQATMIREEGCKKCTNCAYSKC